MATTLILVTSREPQDELYRELVGADDEPPQRVQRIGDCRQPALIAHAVYAGHEAARGLDELAQAAGGRDRSVVRAQGR